MVIDDVLSQHDVGFDVSPSGEPLANMRDTKKGLAASGRQESRFLDLPGHGVDPQGNGPTGRSEPRIMRGKCCAGKHLASYWLSTGGETGGGQKWGQSEVS